LRALVASATRIHRCICKPKDASTMREIIGSLPTVSNARIWRASAAILARHVDRNSKKH